MSPRANIVRTQWASIRVREDVTTTTSKPAKHTKNELEIYVKFIWNFSHWWLLRLYIAAMAEKTFFHSKWSRQKQQIFNLVGFCRYCWRSDPATLPASSMLQCLHFKNEKLFNWVTRRIIFSLKHDVEQHWRSNNETKVPLDDVQNRSVQSDFSSSFFLSLLIWKFVSVDSMVCGCCNFTR